MDIIPSPSSPSDSSFDAFVKGFRLEGEEAMSMKRRALPGESIELEVRFKDKGGEISGINRLLWNNAYEFISEKMTRKIEEYKKAGYIVKGTGMPYTKPARVERTVKSLDFYKRSLRASLVDKEYFDYPYKFTDDEENKDKKMPWSGPILQLKSQYVTYLMKSMKGRATFRLQINSQNPNLPLIWQMKNTNPNSIFNDPNHWLRIAVSTEAASPAPTVIDDTMITRYISRHSFVIDNARVDFSKVYSVSKKREAFMSYELEVEYIFNTGLDDTHFISLVKEIIQAMFKTPIIFNRSDYLTISTLVTEEMSKGFHEKLARVMHINRELFSEAQTLSLYMFNSSFLFNSRYDEIRSYSVSKKVDGFRIIYIFDPLMGSWGIFPPNQAQFFCNTPEHRRCLGMTVLEGEINRGNFWFIDAMVINGVNVRNRENYPQRRSLAREWEANAHPDLFINAYPIKWKTFRTINSSMSTEIFSLIEKVWKEDDISNPMDVDGLIISAEWLTYNELARKKPFRATSDVRKKISIEGLEAGGIYKWKPTVTIDLIVRKNDHTGNIDLFSWDDNKKDVQFYGTPKIPFSGVVVMGEIPFINDSIVEFIHDKGRMVAYKLRLEKEGPNSRIVAEDNWKAVASNNNKIDTDDLLCKSNALMRKSHNRGKASLISKGGGYCVDIGIGQFGDGSKYLENNYDLIIGFDVSEKNLMEARSRLSRMPLEFQKKVMFWQIQNVENEAQEIIDVVTRYIPGGLVDTITMMDSLTFFFDNGVMFNNLVRIIGTCLKRTGVFLWRCMYGHKILEDMQRSGTNKVEAYDDYVEYLGGNEMKVKIAPNIDQTEKIVNIEQLMTATGLVGKADNKQFERMLCDRHMVFSKYFYQGLFHYPEIPTFPSSLSLVFGDEYTTKKQSFPSTSLISTIESMFTSQKHGSFLQKYWELAKEEDPIYGVKIKGEPKYIKFETAGYGYFCNIYLTQLVDQSVRGLSIMERDIFDFVPSPEVEIYYSMAFAYLLGIDVFVVSRLGGREQLVNTNALEESNNMCLLVVLENGKYRVERASGLNPFFGAKSMERFPRLKKRDFSLMYRDCGINNLVVVKPIKTETKILRRVSFFSNLVEKVRLDCLANFLVTKKIKFEKEQIEKIGMEVTEENVEYVTGLMRELSQR